MEATPFTGLTQLSLALSLLLELETATDGHEERLQVVQEVGLVDTDVPVQQEEQLTLHQVDFGQREPKALVAADGGVPGPVLVLWTGVVEVLGCQNQGSQEDAMHCAAHALGDGGQASPQPGQVDQRGHQRRHLHLRAEH